jgi:hypothetical protein
MLEVLPFDTFTFRDIPPDDVKGSVLFAVWHRGEQDLDRKDLSIETLVHPLKAVVALLKGKGNHAIRSLIRRFAIGLKFGGEYGGVGLKHLRPGGGPEHMYRGLIAVNEDPVINNENRIRGLLKESTVLPLPGSPFTAPPQTKQHCQRRGAEYDNRNSAPRIYGHGWLT